MCKTHVSHMSYTHINHAFQSLCVKHVKYMCFIQVQINTLYMCALYTYKNTCMKHMFYIILYFTCDIFPLYTLKGDIDIFLLQKVLFLIIIFFSIKL